MTNKVIFQPELVLSNNQQSRQSEHSKLLTRDQTADQAADCLSVISVVARGNLEQPDTHGLADVQAPFIEFNHRISEY